MQRSLKPPKQSRFVPRFLSLIFCMLNGSSLFVCGMFFVVIEGLLALDKDSFSSFTYIFLSIVSAYKQFLGFLVYMGFLVLLFTGQKYWKKITERLKARKNVTVLAVEHGYPIFAAKEEA